MIQVKLPQNAMETTYRQKKVKTQPNSLQNAMEITCRQNRVKIKSNFLQNTMVVTYMQKKVMIKDGLHGKGLKHGSAQFCLLFLGLVVRLASMVRFLQSITMSAISGVAAGNIFVLYF